MKCLCIVVESNSTILGRTYICESSIDTGNDKKKENFKLNFSKFSFSGVCVRKRVVKIFHDICLLQPNFAPIPDICSRLLRRIHDEESIRKLVLDTFQQNSLHEYVITMIYDNV